MTRPTRDMEIAFAKGARLDGEANGLTRDQVRAGLTAVLAIVERDRAAEVEREWDALKPCPSIDPDHPSWQCEREDGHDGEHRAMRWQLTWDNGSSPSAVDCG